MANKVFNTAFENMLRLLLLVDTLNGPANVDRLAALDFICIYGKKCKVLDRNLHGDNAFGFAEFANKREKIRGCDKIHPNKKGSAPDHLVRGRALRVIIFLQ